MDCCSKCPTTDYPLHSSMYASGRLSHSMARGNNGVSIPSGAFYNHLQSPSMRYPHSMYRLTTPGSGAGYNVIGPPPPIPSSSSLASSSMSSNLSVSPSLPSPAYERYGNYGHFPSYGYGHREGDTARGNFNYANLNHRLDINPYYGRTYENYNRFATNYAYRSAPPDCGPNSMGFSGPYGHPIHSDLRPGPGPGIGPGRYPYYHHGRNGAYDTQQYNYMHNPHHSQSRGFRQQEQHQVSGTSTEPGPYASPALSDIGTENGSEDGATYESQYGKAPVILSESESHTANIENRKDDSDNNMGKSHLRNSAWSSGGQYHVRSGTPHESLIQQHATEFLSSYEIKEEKLRKFKDRDRYMNRPSDQRASACSTPLDSPARLSDRADTPFPPSHAGTPHSQNINHYPANEIPASRLSPYSNYSPYSWSEQYSPKSVRRRPFETSTPPTTSTFVNKNRVLECDFIPSKKSRKRIKAENIEYSPEVREEIKDITPLPGFQQAFGSTEIGRFSETFLNTPERLDCFYESEADTLSPQPWEAGDSLEGPHYNLHIGATVVQPNDTYSENHSSTDSPIETNYFSEIQCSGY